MLGDKSLDCKRRLPSDRFNEFVGSGEYSVGMVDGDLPQVLHQELAARPARNPIGLRIERPRVITRRPSRRGAGHHLRPLLDRHGLVGDFAAEHSANEFGNLIVRQLDGAIQRINLAAVRAIHRARSAPFAALGSEMARAGEETKAAATEVLERLFATLAGGASGAEARGQAIVGLSTMIGAMTLARIVADSPLSEEILNRAKDHLHR